MKLKRSPNRNDARADREIGWQNGQLILRQRLNLNRSESETKQILRTRVANFHVPNSFGETSDLLKVISRCRGYSEKCKLFIWKKEFPLLAVNGQLWWTHHHQHHHHLLTSQSPNGLILEHFFDTQIKLGPKCLVCTGRASELDLTGRSSQYRGGRMNWIDIKGILVVVGQSALLGLCEWGYISFGGASKTR